MRVVLASHSSLAESMKAAAEMFFGEQENMGTIGLFPGDSPEDFEDGLREVVGDTEKEDFLIMVDILSGTPFNTASKISYQNDHVKVIYGMNLPMLAEVLNNRDDMTLDELAEDVTKVAPETYGIGKF